MIVTKDIAYNEEFVHLLIGLCKCQYLYSLWTLLDYHETILLILKNDLLSETAYNSLEHISPSIKICTIYKGRSISITRTIQLAISQPDTDLGDDKFLVVQVLY